MNAQWLWGLALTAALLAAAAPARAALGGATEHVGVWYGYGLGSFLTGGDSAPDSNQMGGLELGLAHDRFRLRAFKGSFERNDLPFHGDYDADYPLCLDGMATRAWTGWPVDVGVGACKERQLLPRGYPKTLGPPQFEHRWGPHLTAARELPLVRFISLWGEADLHYAPFERKEVFLLVDLGLKLHL